jgi:acetyl esterase
MPLDPDLANLLAILDRIGVKSLADGTVEEARAAFDRLTVGTRRPETTPEVGSVEDAEVDGVPLRIYTPEGGPADTAIAFFHGGGFVIGSIETHDVQVRDLCRRTGATVVSVGYRLAPENPWPAAVEDCLAATEWALERFGAVAVAGDSAGANLAAVVAQQLRDRVAAQLLIYPAIDLARDEGRDRYSSRVENATGYFLTADDMRFFERSYAGPVEDRTDPRLSPLYGELAGLPPAVVVTAELDPLRDEGNAYAEALRAAGVSVEHRQYPGLIHGFFGFGGISAACARAAAETCELLAALLPAGAGEREPA